MAVTWLVLFHYLATHGRLLARQPSASFFARERRRALLGLIAWIVAAVALSQPLGSLLIISVLAVFYGATSEGWSGKWNRHQEGSWS